MKLRRKVAFLAVFAGGVVFASPTPAHAYHRSMADCPVLWPGTVQPWPGSCVRVLQRLMDEAGVPTRVDGHYGPATVRSVITIERNYAILPVNGIAGEDVQWVLEWAHERA